MSRVIDPDNREQANYEWTLWTARWLAYGDGIVCKQCLASQRITESQRPFGHLPGCHAIAGWLYPWRDLKKVIRALNIDN